MFPAGLPGAALVLLRSSLALLLVSGTWCSMCALVSWTRVALLMLALALFAGLYTPLVAMLCSALAIVVGLRLDGFPQVLVLLQALTSAALALLGPGAYSIDARLYGRREIDLE